jgi:hypothetical protein
MENHRLQMPSWKMVRAIQKLTQHYVRQQNNKSVFYVISWSLVVLFFNRSVTTTDQYLYPDYWSQMISSWIIFGICLLCNIFLSICISMCYADEAGDEDGNNEDNDLPV